MRLVKYLTELSRKSKDVSIDYNFRRDELQAKITIFDLKNFDPENPKLGDMELFRFNATEVENFKRIGLSKPDIFPAPMGYIWWVEFDDYTGHTETTPKSPSIALKLFAALEEIMKELVKRYNPLQIIFTGKGGSKIKLYDTVSKKIKKIGGFKIGTWHEEGHKVYYLYKGR